MKTTEPETLRGGKAFHKRVQDDWEKTAKGGKIEKEHRIYLSQFSKTSKCKMLGRLDLFVDEPGDFVSVIEIKSTDWDKGKEKNRKKLVSSHRRQVWKYIEEYLDIQKVDVSPGIIYPHSPSAPGLKEMIENHLNEYGLQVVWYDDAH
jgi:t-SNARE complex subunit (syntaxin)